MTSLALLTEALRRAFCCPRQMAEVGGFSLSSAERYWNGIGIPNVVALSRLIRQSPDLLAAFIEYVGLDDAALDAETARLTQLLAELHERRQALHADMEKVPAGRGGGVRLAVRQDAACTEAAAVRVLKP